MSVTVISGSEAADTISASQNSTGGPFASAAADSIAGLGGDDVLRGADGADTLLGGEGRDTLYGDAGGDRLDLGTDTRGGLVAEYEAPGDGADTVFGSNGDDAIFVHLGDDVVEARAGNDLVGGSAGNDRLLGGHGNDELLGETGADSLDGGPGNDLLRDHMQWSGGAGGWPGTDADSLAGGNGADTLQSGGGADTLDGGAGADLLEMRLNEQVGAAVILLPADPLVFAVGALAGASLRIRGIEALLLAGSEAADLVDSSAVSGADALAGYRGDDTLIAGAGNDTLLGEHDNDSLSAGEGDDLLIGGTGFDTLDGGGGNDLLRDNLPSVLDPTADLLQGGAGADTIEAGGAGDTIDGGAGNDLLWLDLSNETGSLSVTLAADPAAFAVGTLGGTLLLVRGVEALHLAGTQAGDVVDATAQIGADTLYGQGGNDILLAGGGHDSLHGGAGNDRLLGMAGSDRLVGGDSNDTLVGAGGADTLDGGQGRDLLLGGAGNDWLHAGLSGEPTPLGADPDRADGGVGADTLVAYGEDTLDGGDGDDLLHWRSTNTTGAGGPTASLGGGAGQDTLAILFSPGDDPFLDSWVRIQRLAPDAASLATFQASLAEDRAIATGVESLVLVLAQGAPTRSVGTVEGLSGGDTLSLGISDDILLGHEGDDSLGGVGGNDLLRGGMGADTLLGGAGAFADTLDGGEGDDRLVLAGTDPKLDANVPGWKGQAEADGGAGNDTITGGPTVNIAQLLRGGDGDDVLVLLGRAEAEGGAGADSIDATAAPGGFLDGGAGADTVRATEKIAYADGGEGDDLLILAVASAAPALLMAFEEGAGFAYLPGGGWLDFDGFDALHAVGNGAGDTLLAAAGADTLEGGAGNDRLSGGAGADLLSGGTGSDSLEGGDGADILRFESRLAGADIVLGFVPGEDSLQVVAGGFASAGGALPEGVLPASRFVANAAPVADAAFGQFLYETDTGWLRWDRDGTGLAGPTAVALLAGKPALAAADILVIG
ncbi:calcium-binding protein [Falsiroseomonas bella]|nr:calcium-binding protein [Falsiroseomonas bella]